MSSPIYIIDPKVVFSWNLAKFCSSIIAFSTDKCCWNFIHRMPVWLISLKSTLSLHHLYKPLLPPVITKWLCIVCIIPQAISIGLHWLIEETPNVKRQNIWTIFRKMFMLVLGSSFNDSVSSRSNSNIGYPKTNICCPTSIAKRTSEDCPRKLTRTTTSSHRDRVPS